MRESKYHIAVDDYEKRVIISCLNEMKNIKTKASIRIQLKFIDKVMLLHYNS